MKKKGGGGNLNATSHIKDDKYLVIAMTTYLQFFIMCDPNFKITPHWGGVENNVTWQIVLESQSSKMLGQGIPTIGTSFRRDK